LFELELNNMQQYEEDLVIEYKVNDSETWEVFDLEYNIIWTGTTGDGILLTNLCFQPLEGCPLDCTNPYYNSTKYTFRISYPKELLGGGTITEYTAPLSVTVYPELREEPYYDEANYPECHRENIPIITEPPCHGGTDGKIIVDINCIVGGVHDPNPCSSEKIEMQSNVELIKPFYSGAERLGIPEIPSEEDEPDPSLDIARLILHGRVTVPYNKPLNLELSKVIVKADNDFTVTQTELTLTPVPGDSRAYSFNHTSSIEAIIGSTDGYFHYYLVFGEGANMEVYEQGGSDGNYFIKINDIVDGGPSTLTHTKYLEQVLASHKYTYTLFKDETFNGNYVGDNCVVQYGPYSESCGYLVFDNLPQGDYLLEVISTMQNGCIDNGVYRDTIYLEQLEAEDFQFVYDNQIHPGPEYIWCEPLPLTLEVQPNETNLNYLWEFHEGEAGASIGEQPNQLVLQPYLCQGGFRDVTIEYQVVNANNRHCKVTLTANVIDLNPPPIAIPQYEEVIGIGATKFKSAWMTDFNDIEVSQASNLTQLQQRNTYATAQTGIFKGFQNYDYLDDHRRQFIDKTGETLLGFEVDDDEYEIMSDLQNGGVIGVPEADGSTFKTIVNGFLWNHPSLEVCAPQWTYNNEITKYNPYNFETENKDILNRYSAALYGYDGKLSTAIAANAEYREIAFESFEEYSDIPKNIDLDYCSNKSIAIPTLPTDDGILYPMVEELATIPFTGTLDLDITLEWLNTDCDNISPAPNRILDIYVGQSFDIGSTNIITSINLNTSAVASFGNPVQVYKNDKIFLSYRQVGPIPVNPRTCNINPGFICIDMDLVGVEKYHQYNNTSGNFDFVEENVSQNRLFLDPIKVLHGFKNYAILDIPYDGICGAYPNPDELQVNFIAQTLQFECREPININERAGVNKTIQLFPDPCGGDNTMIVFKDETLPGFPNEDGEQYWNGEIYIRNLVNIPESAKNLEKVSFSSEQAHTGKISMKLENGNPSDIEFEHIDINLKPNKEYLVSAWIYTDEFKVKPPNQLLDHNIDNTIGIYITVGSLAKIFFAPSGNVIDGWQRIEAKFKTPDVVGPLKISFNPQETMYIDDIRLQPANASIQTYVYDLERYLLQATLDDNNYATIYKYDDEGNLFTVAKETTNGVKYIQVSNSYIETND
jgi:hypothetical protein